MRTSDERNPERMPPPDGDQGWASFVLPGLQYSDYQAGEGLDESRMAVLPVADSAPWPSGDSAERSESSGDDFTAFDEAPAPSKIGWEFVAKAAFAIVMGCLFAYLLTEPILVELLQP